MRSLKVRLTLLFAAVATASIGVLGLALHYALSAQLVERERERLAGKVEQLHHVVSEVSTRQSLDDAQHRLADAFVGHPELRGAVLDRSGVPILRLSDFPWPQSLAGVAVAGPAEEMVMNAGESFRVAVAPAALGKNGDAVFVAVAQSTHESQQILARFRGTVVAGCLLGSLLAGGLGYLAAVRGLRPLRKMVRDAAAISAERLDHRLDYRDAPVELRDMAESFNSMLGRLESSFRRLAEFSADLAHELRTPLTSLMLHSQIALDRPRSEAELRNVLASGLEELERLSRLVNDMLFIAKADHNQVTLALERFAMEEEVAKVLEYFEPLADEQNVRLVHEGSARVAADRSMVRRVIANLVSNAIRHAESGSAVRVRLSGEPAVATVDVENTGVPINPEDAERIFDRFFRARDSRGADGAGLGLAIVKAIVDLHGGRVGVSGTSSGTTFRVTLPRDSNRGSAILPP